MVRVLVFVEQREIRLSGRVWWEGGVGIKIFRHKTKHTKFRIVVPLWMIIWVAVIVLVIIKQSELSIKI